MPQPDTADLARRVIEAAEKEGLSDYLGFTYLARQGCPFCGCDPFHYVDNGLGMEAVAVTCCDDGIALFQYCDEDARARADAMHEAAEAFIALTRTAAPALAQAVLEKDVEIERLESDVTELVQISTNQNAEIERLREALRAFLKWADQKCPCYNDEPNPCPLCGASVENLEGCKAADNTLPRDLLFQARTALKDNPND